jgi:hypothetical protein
MAPLTTADRDAVRDDFLSCYETILSLKGHLIATDTAESLHKASLGLFEAVVSLPVLVSEWFASFC